jgi:hypothetical protein
MIRRVCRVRTFSIPPSTRVYGSMQVERKDLVHLAICSRSVGGGVSSKPVTSLSHFDDLAGPSFPFL